MTKNILKIFLFCIEEMSCSFIMILHVEIMESMVFFKDKKQLQLQSKETKLLLI